jgi:hypothetical protein
VTQPPACVAKGSQTDLVFDFCLVELKRVPKGFEPRHGKNDVPLSGSATSQKAAPVRSPWVGEYCGHTPFSQL